MTILEDNPNSKTNGKHIPMQGILNCNLVLQFVVITCKTFTPPYVSQLVYDSVSLEFWHRFAFGWIISFDTPCKASSEEK